MSDDYAAFCRAAATVAAEFGTPVSAIRDRPPGRRVRLMRMRHVALYLAHVTCGVPMSRVAKVSSVTRRTVRGALRAVEDRRDDPEFDARVQRLEERLLEAVA